MSEISVEKWRDRLAKGDGQGLVPVEIARALYNAGYLGVKPKPRRGSRYVMVRLKEVDGGD